MTSEEKKLARIRVVRRVRYLRTVVKHCRFCAEKFSVWGITNHEKRCGDLAAKQPVT
jgi:hypothetical protein